MMTRDMLIDLIVEMMDARERAPIAKTIISEAKALGYEEVGEFIRNTINGVGAQPMQQLPAPMRQGSDNQKMIDFFSEPPPFVTRSDKPLGELLAQIAAHPDRSWTLSAPEKARPSVLSAIQDWGGLYEQSYSDLKSDEQKGLVKAIWRHFSGRFQKEAMQMAEEFKR